MSLPIQGVLDQVARRIDPKNAERQKMSRLADKMKGKVQSILDQSGITAEVTIQGSFARDTWLGNEADLDIFASFPPTMDRKEWSERILPAIKKGIRVRTIDRYAEHPYLEFYVDGIRVNVVPCYAVEKGEWKSATDRTPFHTQFMKEHLTSEMLREARLLKRFTKGIRVYGAEIEVGGFSGMLVETLILHYRSFLETITRVSEWKPRIFLDLEKPGVNQESRTQEFESSFVVIDPVDQKRNLAAAVRSDKLWEFVGASRALLAIPGTWYFFPEKPSRPNRAKLAKLLRDYDRGLVAVYFEHKQLVPDVLWGQLLKTEKSLMELLARQDFHPLRSALWSDEKGGSAILVEVEGLSLPRVQMRQGPPVSKAEESSAFLERHLGAKDTIRGPRVEGGRWVVDKRREILTIDRLIIAATRDGKLGLGVPEQLKDSFHRTVRVLENKKILALVRREGFDQVLLEFLSAKPPWLRRQR